MIVLGIGIHFTPPQTLNIIETLFHRQSVIVQGLLVGLAIVAIEAFGMEGVAPFIYFQF